MSRPIPTSASNPSRDKTSTALFDEQATSISTRSCVPKWFAAVGMIRLAADQDRLHKATKEISKYWRHKRERRQAPSARRFVGQQ